MLSSRVSLGVRSRIARRDLLHLAAGAAGIIAPAVPLTARPGIAQVAAAPNAAPGFDDVFSLDRVHIIDIRADADKLPILDQDRSVKLPCDVTIDGERYRDANFSEKGDIGSSSTLAEKPSFTIRFGRDRPDGIKKLAINNARQDVTFLHEHIAYELYRRAGLPAPRTAHGLMSLNGRPYGLFVMVEAKDKLFLGRHFGKQFDGGNLYEVDVVDFVDGLYDPVNLQLKDDNDDPTSADPAKRADLQALADAVRVPDELFIPSVAARLDLDSFITAYALDALIGHWDGPMFNTNNYYLYNHPKDSRFVMLMHGIDQGFDTAFDPLQPPKMLLAHRLRTFPELDAQWRRELNRVMEEAWQTEPLFARIDQALDGTRRVRQPTGATATDLSYIQTFGPGLRDALDARRAQWLRQPF